jgi:uridylate kinase
MKKKVIVISLGGSLIIPDNIDVEYLKKFKKIILKNSKKYKFVIVTGGGSIARKYIKALKDIKASVFLQSISGISATRTNARFMNNFIGQNPEGIPHIIRQVDNELKKRDIIFCGALEYRPNQTSDATAAQLASHFNSIFINLTDVPGLYNKNPKKHKDAKFIQKITWKKFYSMANKIKYAPGQHFVLDQMASKIIKEKKTTTYILGKDLKQLDNLLNNKKYKGTIIEG